MAGIYLHIPYCKVKCHYCDFHFSTQHKALPSMLEAMICEIDQRASYLDTETITTIYFGGGTPSLFSGELLNELIKKIKKTFVVSLDAEITIECNPDDLNPEKLSSYYSAGINRLSIGIQSFDDNVLNFMNRAHTNQQTLISLNEAKNIGFINITVDLIYGVPNTDLNYWKNQLAEFEKLNLPHLSSYCLTIEPKTFFGKQHKTGLLKTVPDDSSLEQFQYLMDYLRERNFEHYEISNFAKDGFISKHNSAYWLGTKYLGIGPSAHSFNGTNRGWNIANNSLYIQKVKDKTDYHEIEILTSANRCNDYLLTRLRTKWGIELCDLDFILPEQLNEIKNKILHYCDLGFIEQTSTKYCLTDIGKYRADGIASDLFI